MIKNDFIKLKVSSGLKQNYSKLGYDFAKEEINFKNTYNYNLDKNLAKEKYSKLNGYNFLFLIDKNYDPLKEYLSI